MNESTPRGPDEHPPRPPGGLPPDEIVPHAPEVPTTTLRKRHRILRAIGRVLGYLVLLIVGAVAALYVWLTTAGGSEFVRKEAVKQANATLLGRVEIDRVSIGGLLGVQVRGARLFAPGASDAVVSIGQVDLKVRLLSQIGKRIEVSRLSIERPVLNLVSEGATNNLQRAIALRHPSPPTQKKPGKLPDITISAEQIRIRDGVVTMPGQSPIAVEDIGLDANAHGKLDDLTTSIVLTVHATQPVDKRATLQLSANYGGTKVRVDLLALDAGDSHVRLSANARLDASAAEVRLSDVLIAPTDVNAFIPVKLLAELRLAGRATLNGREVGADVQLSLPAGEVNLDARAELGPPDRQGALLSYQVRVDVDGVDPRKLVAGMPPAMLQARLVATGAGLPPNDHGTVSFDASGSRYEQLPIDQLRLSADVKGLGATIRDFIASAADVQVHVQGDVDAKKAALRVELDAPNLAETHARLGSGLRSPIPRLAGKVHLAATVDGPFASPQILARVSSPSLVVGDNQFDGLDVMARLDSLQPVPFGEFDVSLSRLLVAGRTGRKLEVRGSINDKRANVAAAGTFASRPVRLVLNAVRQPRGHHTERWVMDTLYAQAVGFELESLQPASLAFGSGRLAIAGLRLDSAATGRVFVDASLGTTGPISARVRVRGANVARLPPELLPPGLSVGGLIDLNLLASGTARAPVADLQLDVERGRYKTVGPISLSAEAHYGPKSLQASAKASLPHGGTIDVTTNMPTAAFAFSKLPKQPLPLDGIVSLDHLDLAAFNEFLPEPVKGLIEGSVRVAGTSQSPSLQTRLLLSGFSGFGVDKADLSVDETYARDELALDVEAHRAGAVGLKFIGKTTIALSSLLQRSLNWKKLPVDAHLDLTHFNLAWLSRFPSVPPDVAGSVAGRVSLSGLAGAPHVDGVLQATKVNGMGYHELDALLELRAVNDLQLSLAASLEGHPVLELKASAAVPPAELALMDPADRFAVPFSVSVKLLSTPIAELTPIRQSAVTRSPYGGDVAWTLDAHGTADHPVVHTNVTLKNLTLRTGAEAGDLTAKLDYENTATVLAVDLTTPAGNGLHAGGTMQGALSASALSSDPQKVLDYPIVGFSVVAKQLDLSILNGASSMVDSLAGTLNMSILPEHGTFSLRRWATQLTADVSLERGSVGIVEFGSWSDITLKAKGSGEARRIVVSELKGKSGAGGFKLPPKEKDPIAFEVNERGDLITGKFGLDFDRFPVVQGYQTRGVISLRVRTESQTPSGYPIAVNFKDRLITIDRLVLSHGLVDVPSSIPKGVQSLSPNPDIVLVNKPKPVASTTPGWSFVINSIDIPQKECVSTDPRTTCGPLVINAPLGNRIVLSTNNQEPLSLHVRATAAAHENPVQVNGIVQLDGTVSLIKSKFDLERVDHGELSHVDFTGQPVTDPRLDVKAHLETETQRLDVTVTGPVSDPQKKFDANPPFASDSEVYFYLATGQRQTQAQQNDPTTVQTQLVNAGVSALGSAAFGIVRDKLQSFLPESARLDVLEVSPDVTAASGIGSVKAGKRYLGGNLLVTGQYNPNANPLLNQNTYEVRANYRINTNMSLQALGGTAGHYEAKFLVQKDFCSPGQNKVGLCSKCSESAALAGTCCTPAEQRAGNCQCSAVLLQSGQCQQRQCFRKSLPEAECACTADQQRAGLCARSTTP